MRRILYRSGWLLFLCVLVLALSLSSTAATSTAADRQSLVSFAETSDTNCTTDSYSDNAQSSLRSFLDSVAASNVCKALPETVLIVKDRPVPSAAAGAPALNAGLLTQNTAFR